MGGLQRRYTEELLREAVAHSSSIAGVLRYLELPQAGGTHAHISRTIERFEIDTSHFVRFRNGSHLKRKGADVLLVRIPFGSQRTKPHMLRRALLELGREYRCALCGVDETWQGLPLTLDIDHMDGDFHNNSACNLRFLCPNCHSQTPNFAGRSRGSYAARRIAHAEAASE